MPDGRVERGRRRREQLIEAAVRVVERAGVTAVTHRAVAAEAGVGSTTATHHFPTVDDLLVATVTTGAQRYADEVARRAPATVDDLAELVVTCLTDRRGATLAEYELYLLAARRPALRPAARKWLEATAAVLAPWAADDAALGDALAACDGLMMQGLIADEPPDAGRIAATIARALRSGDRQDAGAATARR